MLLSFRPSVLRSRAFTLIELLTVMAIILVLAGLILSIAGNANYNAAKSRATAEIKAIETACESYKSDNGAYPENSDTDALNPVTDFEPSNSKYSKASNYLWKALSGLGNGGTAGKSYMLFQPGQLKTTDNSPGTATNANNYVVDPFGFSYGYSTIYTSNAAANGGTATVGNGYNPTFDLWSTAGYAQGVRSTPTGTGASGAALYNTLWIKNW